MKVNSIINAMLNGYDSTKEKEKISSKIVFPSKVALERDNDVRVGKKKKHSNQNSTLRLV